MRLACLFACCLLSFVPARAATLERLSLDDMIVKSTEIVRGRVIGSRTVLRGPVVYTLVQVQIDECWKGPRNGRVEVAIPGGIYGKQRQAFSGAPSLGNETDYLLFLWTGRSAVTQVIGLSQGVFVVGKDQNGQQIASRPATHERVLDPGTGDEIRDSAVSMRLDDVRVRVNRVLNGNAR